MLFSSQAAVVSTRLHDICFSCVACLGEYILVYGTMSRFRLTEENWEARQRKDKLLWCGLREYIDVLEWREISQHVEDIEGYTNSIL